LIRALKRMGFGRKILRDIEIDARGLRNWL